MANVVLTGSTTILVTENPTTVVLSTIDAAIDHDSLLNYSADQHRTINDAGTATTDLWSADKITSELASIDLTSALLLAGQGGGQTAYGGTATGEDLTLRSNTAGDGSILIGTGGIINVDEATGRVNIYGDIATDDDTSNTFLGISSGSNIGSGLFCTFIGFEAGKIAAGSRNTYIGYSAGKNTSSGQANTFVGTDAGGANTTGSTNVFVGRGSGQANQTGSGNIFIGHQAGAAETGSNKLYISNSNTATPLIKGDFSTPSLTITGSLTLSTDTFVITTAKTPATAGATGTAGQIAWDADYIYVCTATDTWKRAAIATW